MAEDIPFLGRGWSFPPTFSRSSGVVVMTEGQADIEASLAILLSTRQGERLMQPNYGCDLHADLFENIDNALIAYLKDKVETAILYHEPRIELLGLSLENNSLVGCVFIQIEYRIRTTNTRHNMVYPYCLREAGLVTP